MEAAPKDVPEVEEEHEEDHDEETATAEKLGVQRWDRPAIFRDAAQAATEVGLPYWMVLLLSGAIATLGLALNSAAVVIGAMLIAPLLSPIIGLTMALAVGDGRLAVQMLIVITLSMMGVVLSAALLTALLPFHTVTPEILSRTRPTTLDLAIAVFSGLAGAVVTVARRTRLSAAVPGVAISVALVPPLSVAGFGIGVGWDAALIHGSLLLFGANLGGIVLSGMALFLLVGMQRPNVVKAARQWHTTASYQGLAAWLDVKPLVRSIGMLDSPLARLGLAFGFVVLVGFPLSTSLSQIVRETRIERAVAEAVTVFNQPGRSSILSRQTFLDATPTRVIARIATAEWYGDEARSEFERLASAEAGEPIRLVLEQIPAAGEDIEHIAEMFGPRPLASDATAAQTVAAPEVPDMLRFLRSRLVAALDALALPDSVHALDATVEIGTSDTLGVGVVYTAPRPLSADAEAIVARQFEKSFASQPLHATLRYVALPRLRLNTARPTDADIDRVAQSLRRYPRLVATLSGPTAAVDSVRHRLNLRRVPPAQLRVDSIDASALGARFSTRSLAPAP